MPAEADKRDLARGENGVGISRPPARPHYFRTNSGRKFGYPGFFTNIGSEYGSFLADMRSVSGTWYPMDTGYPVNNPGVTQIIIRMLPMLCFCEALFGTMYWFYYDVLYPIYFLRS